MTTRTLIRIQLHVEGRWAVGGVPDAYSQTAQSVLVDPRREASGGGLSAYLPMTSLAGALREHLGLAQAEEWLGRPPGEREARSGRLDLTASKLALLGAVGLDGAGVSERGVTRIDPVRGAAAGGMLRNEQWADRSEVTVVACHDGEVRTDLLQSLAAWRPFIGRGRGTGQGASAVTSVEAVTVDLNVAHDLTWWLTSRDAWLRSGDPMPVGATPVCLQGSRPDTDPGLVFEWTIDEPVHVGIGRADGDVGDGAVALMARTGGGHGFVPGSSWKGVFAHRVLAILSVVGADESTTRRIMAALFGSVETGRGLLWFGDSVAGTDDSLTRTHIAVDRFSGGVRDGALFQLEAMKRGTSLTLRIAGAKGSIPPPVENLVRHIVYDIHDGLVGVGGNGSRGYGGLKLVKPEVVGRGQPVRLPELVEALADPPDPQSQAPAAAQGVSRD